MAKVLIIRLSALGDVAMLVPVLFSAATHYPQDEFLLLTKSPLLSIFEHRPKNVNIIPVFTKGEHRGIAGLWRLIKQLSGMEIDHVIDVHDVLRSQQIRNFFRLKGKSVSVINKGRKEKKALTRRHNKQLRPLKTSIERYHEAFQQSGYSFPLDFQTIFTFGTRDFSLIEPVVGKKEGCWIGIAPFAKHQGKLYPLAKMEKVVKLLSAKPQTTIFLFGGKDEETLLEGWASQYPQVISVAGRYSFASELLLMSYLDTMLTMDSGNMHLASLVGTPVVSVWGATHPYAGFYGYRQSTENMVDVKNLACRPCSVFGDKACFRKDYACLEMITPQQIVEKIEKAILSPKMA